MSRSRIVIIIALTMALIMTLGFAGCGSSDETGSDQPAGTVLEETDTELTIVDQAGREVTVKKDPQSIALCYRVVIRFLLSLDQGDKITGIGKSEPFLEKLQPSLADCADVGKGVADIEALAELKPDIFFHKASDVETLESVEKIGQNAFEGCTALKELVLPDGLKVIEDYAFDGAGLTSITVPQTVESIGSLSFARCANLTTALVPAALSVSKSSQFYACEALAEISRY